MSESDVLDTCEQGTDTGSTRPDELRWVPLDALTLSGSPRTAGEDREHTRALAESGAEFPPIIVQRGTNRVIDGLHRVRAAQQRGESTIRARFFDGGHEHAFLMAIRQNVAHGLPLSLADRKAAVRRILGDHASWSDRAIASVVALSPKTVAALREETDRTTEQARVGLDGRVRPTDAGSGRERARALLVQDPTLSLRAVSAAAGVSPSTVRGVRDKLRGTAGASTPARPEPPERAVADPEPVRQAAHAVPANLPRSGHDLDATLRALRSDPSLRLSRSGRQLLAVLAVAEMDPATRQRLVVDLPDHCVGLVTDLAAASVLVWQELAELLDRRRLAPT